MGLIASADAMIAGRAREGDHAILIGDTTGHLGQSALLAEAFGREDGDAPAVDLDAERRAGDLVRTSAAFIHAASDLSDGGLALAAFEMAAAAGIGIRLDVSDIPTLFGEDQARYLVATDFDCAEALMAAAAKAGVPIATVGRFGGDAVSLGGVSAPADALFALHASSFEAAVG